MTNYVVFYGESLIGLPLSESAFLENVVCDHNLCTNDL